ncbi:hypothetical protein [Actinoplanes sp. M2I2]|uniref:hypothetical protein n=1 Tax=Actinoplanes sp. M2I2 TaxID=1734444 RepID=UPI00201FB9E8|nr:hypothetical protein [Actinoplanes sp. M2I2]
MRRPVTVGAPGSGRSRTTPLGTSGSSPSHAWTISTAVPLHLDQRVARPALIALTILSFTGSWNESPHTLVAVQDPSLFTLPRGLADLVSGSLGAGTQYPLQLGAALLATIPVAIIFVIFQRYFVRDTTAGADKG